MTEMKGCPLRAASEATLPPLGELEIQEGGEKTRHRWKTGGENGGKIKNGEKPEKKIRQEERREREGKTTASVMH